MVFIFPLVFSSFLGDFLLFSRCFLIVLNYRPQGSLYKNTRENYEL